MGGTSVCTCVCTTCSSTWAAGVWGVAVCTCVPTHLLLPGPPSQPWEVKDLGTCFLLFYALRRCGSSPSYSDSLLKPHLNSPFHGACIWKLLYGGP